MDCASSNPTDIDSRQTDRQTDSRQTDRQKGSRQTDRHKHAAHRPSGQQIGKQVLAQRRASRRRYVRFQAEVPATT
jgi:hypothetical protein